MNKNKKFHLLGAVIATGLLSFSGVLIETAMNVTFPQLITEFGLSTSKIQWVTTIYLLAIAIIIPLSSYFNQRFSSRKLFISGNLLFFLGVLINCFS
ncbi:MAG: MFS transporter, partial [Lactococcus sp.]